MITKELEMKVFGLSPIDNILMVEIQLARKKIFFRMAYK